MNDRPRKKVAPHPIQKPPLIVSKSRHLDPVSPLEIYRGAITGRRKKMTITLPKVGKSDETT